MSSRPRRFTSSRSMSPQKRKALAGGEDVEAENDSPIGTGLNWFMQQTPASQVFYAKIVVGVVLGFVGIFYGIPIIAGNWFIFPLIGIAGVYVLARQYLDISKDDINDMMLLAWHGTISLFIGFICSSALVYMILNPINPFT